MYNFVPVSAITRFSPLGRIEPTAAIDSDLSPLFEFSELVVDLVIGKIQLFSEVFDRFRSFQRDKQRVLQTIRDEPILDWRNNIVPLVEVRDRMIASANGDQVDDLEPSTRRGVTEEMSVSLLEKGGWYEVRLASGNRYEVDVVTESCTCPDWQQRSPRRRM